MSSRKQTPTGVLDLLMNEPEKQNNKELKQESMLAVEQESNKAIKPAIIKTIERESNNTDKQQSLRAVKIENNKIGNHASNKTIIEDTKEKATFNLSKNTLEELEDAWIKLRRKLKGEQRITKMLIVELAIEIAMYELKTKDTQSDLYRRLLSSS